MIVIFSTECSQHKLTNLLSVIHIFVTSFIMNSSMLSEENSNNALLEDFLKLSKISKNFNKGLKKVKQEKESLIIKLSESHPLIDLLKFENTMLFNTIDTLENKLKEFEDLLEKFSSDNLKSMVSIHIDISKKPNLIIDELS